MVSRFHRLSFVVGTVALSIAASRVANDTGEAGSWFITFASVLLIAASDAGRDVDQSARSLTASSGGRPYGKALEDLTESEAPKWLAAAIPAVIFLTVVAVLAFTVESDPFGKDKPEDVPEVTAPTPKNP